MKNAHLQEWKCRVFQKGLWKRSWIFTLLIFANLVVPTASAQTDQYYAHDNFDPTQPQKSGVHGTLLNSQLVKLTAVQTTWNGPQDIWVTAYLPFALQEYNANKPLELFGPHYTTGIALASSINPLQGLYAPVQVRAIMTAPNEPGKLIKSAFAKDLPPGSTPLNITGPFNVLSHLNKTEQSFANSEISQYGISILAAAQQFTKFSHDLLTDKNDIGWNGYDKEGKKTLKFSIAQGTVPGPPTPHFKGDALNDGEIVVVEKTPNIFVTRATVGHEIAHAITLSVHGWQTFTNFSTAREEINEGFADIIGHSFFLWMRPEKFTSTDWQAFRESSLPAEEIHAFNDPKSYGLPNTYQGEYYQTDISDPAYDVHTNGNILSYWFTLLVDGKNGYIDNNVKRGPFSVKQLVQGNTQESYKLALRILFNTFVNKLSVDTNYPLLRDAVAQTATEFGYGPGTHVFNQLENAWTAVGVVSPNYLNVCSETSSNSLINGTVDFTAIRTYLGPNILNSKVTVLIDCSDADTIITMTKNRIPFVDWDNNQIFSDEEDSEQKSMMAVSIHAFSQIAKQWIKSRFGYGGFVMENVLSDSPDPGGLHVFAEKRVTDIYSKHETDAHRDYVSRGYISAVTHFLKIGVVESQNPSLEEGIIPSALADIFCLEIKRDYELNRGNQDVAKLWTINEGLSDPNKIKDFANPKLYGQPSLYHGINWSGDYARNTGFLNLFYYLLVHGTMNEFGEDYGYVNDELPGKVYYISKQDTELVLRILWNAYKTLPRKAGIEEFRQATMTALYELDPDNYGPKSKEHIAFYDAWAAVLGLPDYASTLAHFPEDESVQYPWSAKVGVEVEYPLYESYRLFEVSKSQTFNEAEYPVHRFMNNTAPDQANSMSFGEVNLEPGERYYVRSRLAEGEGSRQFCANTDDPGFCESLLNKKKWTLTYPFTTDGIEAPVTLSPLKGQVVAAWSTPFSWGSIKGARGYDIHVIDPEGTAAEHNIAADIAYDEDNPGGAVDKPLALSKDKPYSYNIAARQRLGSEWAVHVLPAGLLKLLTDAEKAQFPNVYGPSSEVTSFKTDIPKFKLHAPADGAHVPLFGENITVKAEKESPQRADYYQYSFREPLYTDKALETDPGFTHYPIKVQGLIGLEDKKAYEWTFIQRKKATPPFILEEEEGESPGWREFIVDKDLAPKPVIENIDCVEGGSNVVLHWKEVPGAQTYKVQFFNAATKAFLGEGQTGYLGGTFYGFSEYPNKYYYTVKAGVMGGNGEWIFGPEAVDDYGVLPPAPTNLLPNNNNNVALKEENSVELSWQMPPGVTTVRLRVKIKGANELLVAEDVQGNSFKLKDLPFSTEIVWAVETLPEGVCESQEVVASFKTQQEPFVPSLGIRLQCFDGKGAPLGSFRYKVIVTHPNQLQLEKTNLLSGGIGIMYSPGEQVQPVNMDGNLMPMDGAYNVHIEITDVLDDDPLLTDGNPTWTMRVESHNLAPLLQAGNNKAEFIDSLNGDGSFGGLTEGFSVDIPFTYNLKTIKKN